MKKIILLSVVTATTYCFSMGIALAQNYLPNSVKAALRSAEVSETQLAASVVPLDGGKLNLNWREGKKIQPASTEKMITTLAALEMLGPDWRWKTAFSYTNDHHSCRARNVGAGLALENCFFLHRRLAKRDIEGDALCEGGRGPQVRGRKSLARSFPNEIHGN